MNTCGKRPYHNRAEALLALAGAKAHRRGHRRGHRRERRAYFCKSCSAYHLTSQEPKRRLKIIGGEDFE